MTTPPDTAPATRQHIATALRAVHDLDLTTYAYAVAGHDSSLSAALSHARATVAALEAEQVRRTRANHRPLTYRPRSIA